MRTTIILICILFVVACSGQGNQQKVSNISQGEYHEMITEYENFYNADSLLIKVIERDYAVINTLKIPEKTRIYEYEYQKLQEETTEQRKYYVGQNNERILVAITRTSPQHEEITKLRGGDTAHYELKRFDAQGRLIKEESRSEINYPDFDMVVGSYQKIEYEYNTLGRTIKKIVQRTHNGDEQSYEIATTYRGDSDELVSEKYCDLISGTIEITEYRSKHSGDTLIMKAYHDGEELSHIIKKTQGYFADILQFFYIIKQGFQMIFI